MIVATLCQALVVTIAWQDWLHRRIPNRLVGVLAVLALLTALGNPWSDWEWILTNWALAAVITLPGFLRGILGGGDVKLMFAISPLWPPLEFLGVFALGVLSLIAIMLAHAKFQERSSSLAYNEPVEPSTVTSHTVFAAGLPLGSAIGIGAAAVSIIHILQLLKFQ